MTSAGPAWALEASDFPGLPSTETIPRFPGDGRAWRSACQAGVAAFSPLVVHRHTDDLSDVTGDGSADQEKREDASVTPGVFLAPSATVSPYRKAAEVGVVASSTEVRPAPGQAARVPVDGSSTLEVGGT